MISKTLKLNKKSSSVTDLFYTINKERRDEISKQIKIIQDKLKEKADKGADLDGHDLLKAMMFSDIAQSDEEYIYLLITINLFIGEQVGRLKIIEDAEKSALKLFKNLDIPMKGRKVD